MAALPLGVTNWTVSGASGGPDGNSTIRGAVYMSLGMMSGFGIAVLEAHVREGNETSEAYVTSNWVDSMTIVPTYTGGCQVNCS